VPFSFTAKENMTKEREVNPAGPDEVEVSETNEVAGAATPSTILAAEPTALGTTEEPKRRGRGVDRSALSEDELKKLKRDIDEKSRSKRADKKKAANYVFNSTMEPTKAEAKEILTARGLKNDHVINFCYDIGLIAAELNHRPANRFLFANGFRKLQESYEAKAPQTLEVIPPEDVEGELLNRAELYCLYDFGIWRQPDTSFDQWLANRLKFKMSAFEFSKILGKEDFGNLHEQWTSFAPRWNPIGLKPNYTLREALTWLDAQSDTKKYLLIASRNSMKSTWARILALTLTITCPDAPMLIVSETNKLSKKAMREFRGYLEMNPNFPSLFQQYFGEYTIAPNTGQSSTYENPLAHLGLPQIACESSSMESANTGSRFWLCLFDDPISRDNGTSNEDQRAEAISKHGSIMKLRDPAGYALNVQTPWTPEDLGDAMIQQNNKDPEHPLAVRIDPVFEIRPEAKGKGLLDLTETDVLLNFLPKLNWRFVRDEMRSPEGLNFFKTQYLCQWIREDSGISCQFEHDELWHRVKPASFFPTSLDSQVWMSMDRSYSVSKYSDLSALVVGRIQPVENRLALVINYVHMERLKESDLTKKIVDLISIHQPSVFIAERDKNWEDLWQNVIRLCGLRGIVAPYFRWIAIDNSEKSFARRVKSLELPISDGRIWFSNSFPQLEQLLLQFERFDGKKRSGSSIGTKDDGVAAVSLMFQEARSLHHSQEIKPEDEEQRRRNEEEEGAKIRRNHFNNLMFGNTYTPPPPKIEEEAPQKPADPRDRVFSYGRAVLPSSDHSTLFGAKGRWRR
jgi:hypothetical protein